MLSATTSLTASTGQILSGNHGSGGQAQYSVFFCELSDWAPYQLEPQLRDATESCASGAVVANTRASPEHVDNQGLGLCLRLHLHSPSRPIRPNLSRFRSQRVSHQRVTGRLFPRPKGRGLIEAGICYGGYALTVNVSAAERPRPH